ncbi:unnamed protein product [Staurois parvus]|uniref:Uncharacterized protein n=1 Tax=Staurois parvus TaxID=386267 RepID=A0ABN9GKM3_9NEOB|nr:unnamed protein product [Staurois parvus]
MLSLVCIAKEVFFSWESACIQHRTNQHCPDRGQGVSHPQKVERKLILQALTSAQRNAHLKSQDCSNC